MRKLGMSVKVSSPEEQQWALELLSRGRTNLELDLEYYSLDYDEAPRLAPGPQVEDEVEEEYDEEEYEEEEYEEQDPYQRWEDAVLAAEEEKKERMFQKYIELQGRKELMELLCEKVPENLTVQGALVEIKREIAEILNYFGILIYKFNPQTGKYERWENKEVKRWAPEPGEWGYEPPEIPTCIADIFGPDEEEEEEQLTLFEPLDDGNYKYN